MKKPELLAPAGNLEKLKVAVLYGADAVYLSGGKYGLRAFAGNLTSSELKTATEFAHQYNSKVYVTLNSFLHDSDLEDLGEFCKFLESIKIDAVIVSDLGVVSIVKKHCKIPIHLSTQASCLNTYAAKAWKKLGVSRVVLGRETSILEAAEISKEADLEVETFAHGAMCMAYSGNCTISNYTAGRDSNRGGCIQSCRFEYKQTSSKLPLVSSHFMSSKDLESIAHVESFVKNQISSLKVEGRMKSLLYIATITRAYRRAIDAATVGDLTEKLVSELNNEINSVPHRDYTSASLLEPAGHDSIYLSNDAPNDNSDYTMLGIIIAENSNSHIVELYKNINLGDEIEILGFNGETIITKVISLRNGAFEDVDSVRQNSIALIEKIPGAKVLNVIRAKKGAAVSEPQNVEALHSPGEVVHAN